MFPVDDKQRKALPIFDGAIMYFPDALAAVAEVSRIGNAQHNPGEPLHWARGKSMDQFNTAVRHLIDHKGGCRYDADGGRHLAKCAWRILAALQLDIEAEQEREKLVRANTPLSEGQLSGCIDAIPEKQQEHTHPQGCTCGVCWVARADAERKYGKVLHSPEPAAESRTARTDAVR
jgi:hypothetical protein